MPTKLGLKEALMKNYEKVIEARLESDEALRHKTKLFQTNAKTIQGSLKTKLDAFSERLKTEETIYNEDKKTLKLNLQKTKSELKKKEKTIQNKTTKDLTAIEDDYEKKQSLNTLKEQKIESDYQARLDRIAKKMQERQIALDKSIESSTQTFYDQTVQLEKETDTQNAKLENTINQKNSDYSSKIDQVNAATKKVLDASEQTKTAQIDAFKKALKKLMTEYKEVVKPAEEELKKLQTTQAKARQKIVDGFDETIAKILKYKKEKEKLKESSEVNRYTKELKAHRKEKDEALNELDAEHTLQREPYETKLQAIIDDYKKQAYALKETHIQAILETLITTKKHKTQDMIKTNEVNIERLIEEARFNHAQTTLKIDYDIQLINFNQTLEEARLAYDRQSAILKPETQKLNDEQKRQYNQNKNDLTTKRQTEKAEFDVNGDTRKIDQKIDLENVDYELKKHDYHYTYDKIARDIEFEKQKITNDFAKETILVGHYYHNAKNYTALKNDEIMTYKPSHEKAIEHERTNQIKQYNTMLAQAEKDHDRMVGHIDDTFELEIAIYQEAIDRVEKHHNTTIKDLMAKQALERNKDLSLIESLDAKKDKARIKRLKRDLNTKQEHHDETIALKKRELEQKRQLYQHMIEQTKSFKMHSTEEAETLLIHIKDQIHDAIERVERNAQQAINTFDTLYYEVKHNANLFNIFQLQRQDDTLDQATHYKAARIKSQQELLAHHKQQLNEQLSAIKKAFDSMIESYKKERDERTKSHESKIEIIKKVHQENAEHIDELYENDAKKLNQQIQRLQKDYDQRLKTLTQDKKSEKEACFEKKDEAEKAHETILKRREDEAQNYQAERERMLEEDITRLTKHKDALLASIEQEPLKHLTEQDLKHIEAYLEGQKTIPEA